MIATSWLSGATKATRAVAALRGSKRWGWRMVTATTTTAVPSTPVPKVTLKTASPCWTAVPFATVARATAFDTGIAGRQAFYPSPMSSEWG